ncbi:MAG: SMP-30/gluconolactonase/LRE family protein [Acidobacteriota bacterium]
MFRRAGVVSCVVALAAGAAFVSGQETAPGPSRILAPGAKVEKVAGDFIFTEGATADDSGNVYFVDQDNNRIMDYDTAGKLTTFMQPSGYSNGMTYDGKGHLIAGADEKNELWSIDIKTKKATPLFNTYEGKLLNGPNDVWVHPKTGRIYITDPYYPRKWWNRGPKENPETVYMYEPSTKKLTRIIDDLTQPNGIIGTPDGKKLYVADIRARMTYAYDLNADGSVANKTLFVESGSDGMTIDSEGNIYLTSRGAVQVYDKAGKPLESIPVPESPSNVCFGGKDKKTLFITARTGFYAVKTVVHGVGYQ